MNPSIAKLVLGKTEAEAGLILQRFDRAWRVTFRDGKQVSNLTPDRDDNRYGLVLEKGLVKRVMFG